MMPSQRTYKWFYDHIQSVYYDLLVKWCFFVFGGETKIRHRLIEPVAFGGADRILEVGCGTGSATAVIASQAGPQARIIGIDLSRGQLTRAWRKNRCANVQFLEADATATCFLDTCFDKVFVTHIVHELPRNARLKVFAEAERVLTPGGQVIVLELDNPNSLLLRLYMGLCLFYWLPFNFETPTRRDMFRHGLVNEVRQAGFVSVSKTSVCRGAFQVAIGRSGNGDL